LFKFGLSCSYPNQTIQQKRSQFPWDAN
jgi:hypothetical protein